MIDIPKELVSLDENSNTDLVSYFHNKKQYEMQPCYSGSMDDIRRIPNSCGKFILIPANRDSLLPFNIFVEWIELCKKYKLVEQNCFCSTVQKSDIIKYSGNQLSFSPTKNSKFQRIYSTFCCFRWAENQPKTPYAAVMLYKKFPHLDFYQILHRAMLYAIKLTSHSFCSISCYSYCGARPSIYIEDSVAIKRMYYGIEDKPICETSKTTHYVNSQIESIKNSFSFSGVSLSDADKLLDKRITEFYNKKIIFNSKDVIKELNNISKTQLEL